MRRAALTLLLAVVLASETGAQRYAGSPTAFKDHLPLFDAVFIGYVDSVSDVQVLRDQPCAQGFGPREAIRWVVRVDEALQGSALHMREVVYGVPGANHAEPGQRVLAFGNRSCTSDWHISGYAFPLDGDTVRTDCSYFDNSEALDIRHPWDSLWDLLRPLREHPHAQAASVFDGFDGLGVFVTARAGGEDPTWDVTGRWVGAIVGPAPSDSVRLRFHPLPGWAAHLSAGDTLIVPWTGATPAQILTFEVSPRALRVEHGMATMLGRPMDAIPALIVRRDERFRIPPIVYP